MKSGIIKNDEPANPPPKLSLVEGMADHLYKRLILLPNSTRMVFADMFAMGCFAHLNGNKNAGFKTCDTALNMLENSKTLQSKILNNLQNNEMLFAMSVCPHVELMELFDTCPTPNLKRKTEV